MSQAAQEPRRYTFADVLDWPENERVELIDGRPIMMSPPKRIHQKVAGEIYRQIADYLADKKCEVYHAPFGVRLFEQDGDKPKDVETLVEPDITVVCDHNKLDDDGCKGAPDLIVEVLSPNTQRHDRLVKYNLYEQAGVKEFWLVNPVDKSIQVFLLEDGRYTPKDFGTVGDTLKVNVLDACNIDLSKVFP